MSINFFKNLIGSSSMIFKLCLYFTLPKGFIVTWSNSLLANNLEHQGLSIFHFRGGEWKELPVGDGKGKIRNLKARVRHFYQTVTFINNL